MNKYLELVFSLLEIEKDAFSDLAQLIEKNPNKKLVISHKYGFIFHAFQDFLNKKISQEEFIQIGDIDSLSYENRISSQDVLDSLLYEIQEKWACPKNTIFVLDKKVIDSTMIKNILSDKILEESSSSIMLLD